MTAWRALRTRTGRLAAAITVAATTICWGWAAPAHADTYVPISGAGSTWSQNALQTWIAAVSQYGERVNYAGTGSSDGRNQFRNGTVDFADSDIPFQTSPQDGSQPEKVTPGTYAYIPITAGGTVFMYNLTIAGHRVTNLRLSGANIAKIFTGQIKTWNDPAIQADNPGLVMPSTSVVPVVRSDGSGSTAQFTAWMINQYPTTWNQYCQTSGRAPTCGETSNYPTIPGMVAQSGDLGVAGYVSQGFANGAVGYVNYSYALQAHFPVIQMLNAAGYYTEPTPQNVAVSLLAAQVETQNTDPSVYLTQKLQGVYTDPDPRTYPLSSYSYMIIPTTVQGQFNAEKGKTLAAFDYYAMCQGQQSMASLGYSPMPVNLVQDSFDQIKKIPGAVVQNITIQQCNNPTFDPKTGNNLLAEQDPQPPACDKQGPTQCSAGTGGAYAVTTPVKPAAAANGTGAVSPTGTGGSAGSTGTVAGSAGSAGSAAGTSGGTAATGAAAGTTGAAGAAGATATGAAISSACDPSAGDCAAAAGAGGAQSAQNISATPASIPGRGGWGGAQTLMLLAGLLVLAIVFAPGVATRVARRR